MALESYDELEELFGAHAGDGNAPGFTYTGALAAFARRGAGAQARALLGEARELNPHIRSYLTGRKKLPIRRPGYTVFGEESEAVDYAAGAGELWGGLPGALAWLESDPRTSGPVHRVSRGMVHAPRDERAGCPQCGRLR